MHPSRTVRDENRFPLEEEGGKLRYDRETVDGGPRAAFFSQWGQRILLRFLRLFFLSRKQTSSPAIPLTNRLSSLGIPFPPPSFPPRPRSPPKRVLLPLFYGTTHRLLNIFQNHDETNAYLEKIKKMKPHFQYSSNHQQRIQILTLF